MENITFVDTTIRDGQQSLWAMGMRTGMMLPILEKLDQAGFDAIEIGAAGTEKKVVRELREDPFERIRLARERVRKTPLRTIRGRYLAAFQITPDAVEQLWFERMVAHGITQVRISDCSNTSSSWASQVAMARGVGMQPIVNLIFSLSPKHSDAYYAQKAREAAALNPFRICLKDPGALLTPERLRTLLPAIQAQVKEVPLEFHTHCNTGLGTQCSVEAIKLGVRCINAAIPPLAESSSNPSLFDVARNARAMGYGTSIDEESLKPVEAHFRSIALREGLPMGAPAAYDEFHYIHQVPGGMISNLRFQLGAMGLGDKLGVVLEEISRVRADLGYPIMVTPYSQFTGAQAVMNVVAGERYKVVADEVIQYALGFWGDEERDSMDPNVRDKIVSRDRAKTLAGWKPAQPSLKEVRQQLGGAGVSDDDLLLRFLTDADQVATMRAAGAVRMDDASSLQRLLAKVGNSKHVNFVSVRKGDASITVQRNAPAAGGAA
jgi:oxaloacetate decarboxylase alpha subunit